jgi:ATP-dependent DNA helicase RecG
MTEAELNISNEELLSKLKLLSNGKLKRSAVLLFYGDPSIVQVGSFVKVGKFANGTVEYHDDLEGSLISTADKIVDLIYLKYLKAKISYEHDRRVETYPFARNAIREAIYNAIAHNCYMYGTPIQIRIEEEQIIISNRCILPEGWTAETLMQPHDSIPYNPDIANVFYRAGYIETWGQGIQKICDECIALGAELPKYEIIGTGLRVYFPALKSALIDQPKAPKHQNTDKHSALDDAMVLRIIEKLKEQPDISQEALGESIGVTRRVVQKYINALKEAGRIERVGGKRYGHWEIKE